MAEPGSTKDEALMAQFVSTFGVLDDTIFFEDLDPAAVPLATGRIDERGFHHWEPRAVSTPRSALSQLYQRLPATFPPLYEELILSYRWAEVDLVLVTLLPNPLGPDLSGLSEAIFRDPELVEILLPNGLLQFGKPGGGDYDPICFDTRARGKNGEAPVVRVDHEEILCNHRLKVTDRIAPTFRAFAEAIIAKAAGVGTTVDRAP
jgi:hypothetical protein